MPLFQHKANVIEAYQWCKNGDHPYDGAPESEGNVVRRFRRPDVDGETICEKCQQMMCSHGWIDQGEEGLSVCPGDWIVRSLNRHSRELSTSTTDELLRNYEKVSI